LSDLVESIQFNFWICYNLFVRTLFLFFGGTMSLIRLDRIICDSGNATRSEAKKLISGGRVSVNGRTETRAEQKIDSAISEICIDEKPIRGERYRYILLYKPVGVLSATEDRSRKTVLSLLPQELQRLGLFPVGRLDKDTTGLIILTNDGDFCHAVTSPKRHIEKLYEFRTDGELTAEDASEFKKGAVLRDGTKCLPAELQIDGNDPHRGLITVYEGKYHQVKRMLASRGKKILDLKRVAVGALSLDGQMKPGDYRELSEAEKELVFQQ